MDFNHNGKDDIQEIKDGFAQFATDIKSGDINAVFKDISNAGGWIKVEIEGMAADAQNFFNWGLQRVKDESASFGEAVANMLTLLANGNLQGALGLEQSSIAQLAAVATEIVNAAVSLLGFKAATA